VVQTVPLPPITAPVPVELRIGDYTLKLGELRAPGRRYRDPRPLLELANLLRLAAEACGGHRHAWPRQRWYVGDKVRLPGAVAHGVVAQVDVRAKTYLVDLGWFGVVSLAWSEVDQPHSRCVLDAEYVRSVLSEFDT